MANRLETTDKGDGMGAVNWGKYSYGDVKIIGSKHYGIVNVGKYCSLAEDIRVFMANDHIVNNISTYPFGHKGKPITNLMKVKLSRNRYHKKRRFEINIGNDVWIGSHSIIFREVKIGDGAVIGAYSIITKDVEPYTVVVGNDRVLRKRFSDEDIEFLLRLKWWDKPDEEVASIGHILCSPDIHELRRIYG